MKDRIVMDGASVDAALTRIAEEIASRTESFRGTLALVGILTRGVPLAERLARRIEASSGRRPQLGVVDITLYRDDLTTVGPQPIVRGTDLDFPIDEAWIVLVDDVLFTGRTVRAAITELVDFGRPRKIELAVLVDRGFRELPIQADYVGATIATTREQMVAVGVAEEDGADEVRLLEGNDA
jgi:pyrimidine operon attenuation protein/uracil phosphoribosyltransferase